MIDKWSGSIEVGVTTHNPSLLDFPATMTNMRSGTIMMSGCGILTNGKGTQREYGQFNLDELSVSTSLLSSYLSNCESEFFGFLFVGGIILISPFDLLTVMWFENIWC